MGMVEVSMPTAAPAMNLLILVSRRLLAMLVVTISPSNHQHGHINGGGLQDTANKGDNGTCGNGSLSSNGVRGKHVDDRAQHSATLEGGYYASSDRAVRVIEVLDELGERDDASDDTGVVTEEET